MFNKDTINTLSDEFLLNEDFQGIFKRSEKEDVEVYKDNEQIVPKEESDGSIEVLPSGVYSSYLDTGNRANNENQYLNLVRNLAMEPEFDSAILEIVNECVIIDEDEYPIKLDLDSLEVSDNLKKKISNEFKEVLRLLDFNQRGDKIFKQWYIDGKLYYHVIIDDKNPKKGIIELRNIDPRKIKKFKEIERGKGKEKDIIKSEKEWFLFNHKQDIYKSVDSGIKIHPDRIIYTTSGLRTPDGRVVSWLHKAVKRFNQLRLLEESVIIYRFSRAPERRVFYVGTSGMPPKKAQEQVKEVMNRFRNKVVYNACLAMDTRIPLLDGRILTIAEMQKEFEEGKQLWIYSCEPNTGKFAPGLVSSVGVTKFDQEVMKITLDNGESITCTYDHKFPLWSKGKTEAKDLVVGDSLIPFYSRMKTIHPGKNEYVQIYDNDKKKWLYVHRLVSQWKDEIGIQNEYCYNEKFSENEKLTVHHKNYNRVDNTPDNLTKMNRDDHFDYHHQHSHLSGKIGGKVTAQRKKERGEPYFNLTDEQRSEIGRKNGKIYGKKNYEEKKGIHGLTKEETLANSKKGNERHLELLKNNPEYRENISLKLKEYWTEERRIERGHFLRVHSKKQWEDPEKLENFIKAQSIDYPERMLERVFTYAYNGLSGVQIVKMMNSEFEIIKEWRDINDKKEIKSWHKNKDFQHSHLRKISEILGFENFRMLKEFIKCHNHKVVNIEFLEEKIDVGTLGIDKDEVYHNYHTFALAAGVYTFNSTGEISEQKKYMSLLEDYFIPRGAEGKDTEITTIPGTTLANSLEDVEIFRKQFYLSLNVPISRLEPSDGFSLGRASEISREEVKFARFCTGLRLRFSDLFDEILKRQLLLKNIVNEKDWDRVRQQVKYKYNIDNHFQELLNQEVLQSRIRVLQEIETFTPRVPNITGKYAYSWRWVQSHVLLMTDEEIEGMDKECEQEHEMIAERIAQESPMNYDTNGNLQQEPEQTQDNLKSIKNGN